MDSKKQLVDELHKPARKKFKRRQTKILNISDLWQIDLAEMQPYARINKGFRYILVVINCYSKYVWTEPLKNKTGLEVAKAMRLILQRAGIPPANLQSDFGTELYNKHFQKLMNEYKINHYSTYSTTKAAIVERVIRTLKNMIYKQFSMRGKHIWYDLLEETTNRYNNTKHRTIGMKPNQVTAKTVLNAFKYPKIIPVKAKFKIGQIVRISKHKGVFSKGYLFNWTPELFKIVKINATNPITYLLEDFDGAPIKGCFYEQELQKTHCPNIYLVEKILGHRKKNGIQEIRVKWLGFKQTSWVNRSDLLK